MGKIDEDNQERTIIWMDGYHEAEKKYRPLVKTERDELLIELGELFIDKYYYDANDSLLQRMGLYEIEVIINKLRVLGNV